MVCNFVNKRLRSIHRVVIIYDPYYRDYRRNENFNFRRRNYYRRLRVVAQHRSRGLRKYTNNYTRGRGDRSKCTETNLCVHTMSNFPALKRIPTFTRPAIFTRMKHKNELWCGKMNFEGERIAIWYLSFTDISNHRIRSFGFWSFNDFVDSAQWF